METFVATFLGGSETLTVKGKGETHLSDSVPFIATNLIQGSVKTALDAFNEAEVVKNIADEGKARLAKSLTLMSLTASLKVDSSKIDFPDDTADFVREMNALRDVFINGISDVAKVILFARAFKAPASPIVIEDKSNRWGRIHKSDSLLGIAWAEIWHYKEFCIKNVKLCPYCYQVYIAPPNNPNKQNCGSAVCKKLHLIESHGGIEGYRKWENERKISRPGNRPVGRPHKKV